MNAIQKPEIILIDFDGVISKNSVFINIQSIHSFINQYTPIPFELIFSFFKSTMCFSMPQTLSYLLKSLGIEDKISELFEDQQVKYDNTQIIIENGFYQFLDFCDQNSIRYLVYSSREDSLKKIPELIHRIQHNIYNLNGRSKANGSTYSDIASELAIDLKQCLYIDDTPLALRTGKLHGVTTVMMLNDVFTLQDYQLFHSYIDYKISSFNELLEILRRSFS